MTKRSVSESRGKKIGLSDHKREKGSAPGGPPTDEKVRGYGQKKN